MTTATASPTTLLNIFQARVLRSVLLNEARVYGLPGGRGGGKTFLSLLVMLLISERPGTNRICIGGTSLGDIRANTEEALMYWANHLGVPVRWPSGSAELQVGHRTWEARGMVDSSGSRRVRGRTYASGYVDELSEVLEQSWHMFDTSCRGPGSIIIASWNPQGPSHFTEKIKDRVDAKIFHSTADDNLDHLPETYIQTLEQLPEWQRRRLRMGLASLPEGLVYPSWEPVEHDPAWEGTPCIVGADYAESGISAAVYIQNRDKEARATREFYHHGHTQGYLDANALAVRIRDQAPGPILRCYVDPNAVALIEALTRAGVPARRGWNDRKGYDITNASLNSGRLKIVVSRCPNLVSELEALVYAKGGEGPDPNCVDHATDSLRYCVATDIVGNVQYG